MAASGYGFNISGRLPFPFWNERDQLLFQYKRGSGLGRYISDLGSFGGQDGSIDNFDIQPDDALHLTRRSSINFIWSPIPRLDLVTELLWGRRQNKDGQHGSAAQTQIGSTFRF